MTDSRAISQELLLGAKFNDLKAHPLRQALIINVVTRYVSDKASKLDSLEHFSLE